MRWILLLSWRFLFIFSRVTLSLTFFITLYHCNILESKLWNIFTYFQNLCFKTFFDKWFTTFRFLKILRMLIWGSILIFALRQICFSELIRLDLFFDIEGGSLFPLSLIFSYEGSLPSIFLFMLVYNFFVNLMKSCLSEEIIGSSSFPVALPLTSCILFFFLLFLLI